MMQSAEEVYLDSDSFSVIFDTDAKFSDIMNEILCRCITENEVEVEG